MSLKDHIFRRGHDRAERTSIGAFFGAFLAIVFVRYLLEAFSSGSPLGEVFSDLPTLVHYTLFFAVGFLLLVHVASAFSGVPVRKVARLGLRAFPVIWTAPIVDVLLGGPGAFHMGYLFPDRVHLLQWAGTFFGPLGGSGITPGIRVETAVIVFGIAFFVAAARKRLWPAVAAALTAYAAIYALVAFPAILVLAPSGVSASAAWRTVLSASGVAVTAFHPSLMPPAGERAAEMAFDIVMGRALLLVLWVTAAAAFFRLAPAAFRATLRNSRPYRVAHYLGLLVLGMLSAAMVAAVHGTPLRLTAVAASGIAVAALSLYAAWMFQVGVNDLADARIDAVSNKGRPLVAGTMDEEAMRGVSRAFFVLSVVGGFLAGSYVLFFVLAFHAAYYVYSVPPLRLKRVPILASFLISLACLSAYAAGFFLLSPFRTVAALPAGMAALIVVGFTLAANVKDLKDVEGDAKEGIRTLPVLLGPVRGRRTVGAMVAVAFLSVPAFLGAPFLVLTSVPAAVAGYLIVASPRFREPYVFLLYFGYAVVSALPFVAAVATYAH